MRNHNLARRGDAKYCVNITNIFTDFGNNEVIKKCKNFKIFREKPAYFSLSQIDKHKHIYSRCFYVILQINKSAEDLLINKLIVNEDMRVAGKGASVHQVSSHSYVISNRRAVVIKLALSGLKPRAVSLVHVADKDIDQ